MFFFDLPCTFSLARHKQFVICMLLIIRLVVCAENGREERIYKGGDGKGVPLDFGTSFTYVNSIFAARRHA